MNMLLRMAIRNLRRHLRRTLLSTATIAIGLGVILWLQCILAGRNQAMVDRVTSTRTGHLQIHRVDYLKDRSIQQFFPADGRWAQLLPPGSVASRRILMPSMISSGEQSATLLLMGIEPEDEARVTEVRTLVKQGEYLSPEPDETCPSRQILIGRALAELLHVQVGNKLVIMTQAADGTLGNDLFRVKGLYDSGSPDADKAIAFAPLKCVAKVGAIGGVHEVAIRLADAKQTDATIARLSSGMDPSLRASTWMEAMPTIASVMRLNDAVLMMITAILFIVITLGIVNVLLIGVFERTREFGVMIALGTTPRQLMRVILVECLVLGVGSTIVGTLLGGATVAYHHQVGFDLKRFLGSTATIDQLRVDFLIYPIFELGPYLGSVLLTLAFVMIAGVYPAIRAARLNPVEAMRST
jgi:ABC-type lipoprotein release transport system permease subunit